jgi:hypothetical protein
MFTDYEHQSVETSVTVPESELSTPTECGSVQPEDTTTTLCVDRGQQVSTVGSEIATECVGVDVHATSLDVSVRTYD